MPRVYVFMPLGCWEPGKRIIRYGFTNGDKQLARMFDGLNEPSIILLEEQVPEGREAFDKLQQIIRGNDFYAPGKRFRWYHDFKDCLAGYNFKETLFSTADLIKKFAEVALKFKQGGGEPGADAGEELQPPVEHEGEQVVMRSMSSAQAAAIMCGVPGSIESVINEIAEAALN